MEKKILDVCCGGKMFWFNKNHPKAIYLAKRVVNKCTIGTAKNARKYECQPDIQMDFTDLKFSDNSFSLVVFDPPHFTSLGENSYMAKKYGRLNKNNWKQELQKGFQECFRVLIPEGILIFKWCEHDIPLSKVLKLTTYKPLFGQRRPYCVRFAAG